MTTDIQIAEGDEEFAGWVVYYEDEYDGGAFIPITNPWSVAVTRRAMLGARSETDVYVKKVSSVPEWVEQGSER